MLNISPNRLTTTAAVATLLAVSAVRGSQYLMTVHATFTADQSSSETWDGTNYGSFDYFPLDNARLHGGTMLEHFLISDVNTASSGSFATYAFEPASDWTFELYDPAGALVHRGTESFQSSAAVENNYGGAPYTVDQLFIQSQFAKVTNLNPRSAGLPLAINIADASFYSYVSDSVNFLNDLSLPFDPAVYMSFPAENRVTDVLIQLGSGDIENLVKPYAYTASFLTYTVDSLTITPIPEPAHAAMLLGFAGLLNRRFGRRIA